MNELYSRAHAVVTKPGGVTISEALAKQVPIFIHSALPGQEQINQARLLEQGLVFKLEQGRSLQEQIGQALGNEARMGEYRGAVQQYINARELKGPDQIYSFIKALLPADSGGHTAV